jgi:hypothetical protein
LFFLDDKPNFPSVSATSEVATMKLARPWAHFRIAGLVFLGFALAACASAPVQEMSDARQAIAAARQAGAAQEAPAELTQAKHYLQNAEQALQHHDYERARSSANQARHVATGALDLAHQVGKENNSDAAH